MGKFTIFPTTCHGDRWRLGRGRQGMRHRVNPSQGICRRDRCRVGARSASKLLSSEKGGLSFAADAACGTCLARGSRLGFAPGASGDARDGRRRARSARWADSPALLATRGRRRTRCVRWRELRSDNCGESVHEARCARPPRACAARRAPRRPSRASPAAGAANGSATDLRDGWPHQGMNKVCRDRLPWIEGGRVGCGSRHWMATGLAMRPARSNGGLAMRWGVSSVMSSGFFVKLRLEQRQLCGHATALALACCRPIPAHRSALKLPDDRSDLSRSYLRSCRSWPTAVGREP